MARITTTASIQNTYQVCQKLIARIYSLVKAFILYAKLAKIAKGKASLYQV